MSVLIKGMDKETAVRICAYTGVRMDDSDFVPVPPHGRLIDADALREDWLENGENEYIYDTNAILCSLDAAPTIIPAEEEKNINTWPEYRT